MGQEQGSSSRPRDREAVTLLHHARSRKAFLLVLPIRYGTHNTNTETETETEANALHQSGREKEKKRKLAAHSFSQAVGLSPAAYLVRVWKTVWPFELFWFFSPR